MGTKSMPIVITLSPELERQLQAKATRQGQDINLVATKLLTIVLESEAQDSAENIINSTSSIDKHLRPFGLCAGEFTVPDDFEAPLPEEILSAFEGK
jgi:hypothetical protein